jgi:ABC-2 type transport system permease protein
MVMKNKKQDIFQFTGVLLILVLLNFIASVKHMRIDLSKEGRYSLSESTKNMLAKLDDYIYVEVYLEGDFPAGIERLSMETRQILAEFKNQNNLLQYTFINPTESTD